VIPEIRKTLLVFAGGGVGAACRYLLAGLVQQKVGLDFPLGTLTVNVLGSFLIGVVMGLSEHRLGVGTNLRLLVAVGGLGGFTTYSTFSYETISLLEQGSALAAGLNATATLTACLAGAWLGLQVGRVL